MALSGAVAIVAMNVVPMMVNAAGVNPTFSPIVLGAANDVTDDVVTVTLPDALVSGSGSDVMTVVITNSVGGVFDASGSGTVVQGLNSTLAATATGITITKTGGGNATFTFTPGVAGNFGVSVVGTANFGAAVVSFGNANVVTVSATVIPTLSLNLANPTVAFGVLTPGTVASGSTTPVLTVKSNASAGYTLQIASTNSGMLSGTDLIASANELLTDNNGEGYGIQASKTGSGTISAPYAGLSGDTVAAVGAAVPLMTGTRTAGDTATLTLKALASASTAAGNYTDTLTFTLAGTF